MNTIESVLELFKTKYWNYAVGVFYGEDIGCDDMDIAQEERSIKITGSPVGCLGGAKVMWAGKLKDLATFDFDNLHPTIISNPPTNQEYKETGFYIWGTSAEHAIERWYS